MIKLTDVPNASPLAASSPEDGTVNPLFGEKKVKNYLQVHRGMAEQILTLV